MRMLFVTWNDDHPPCQYSLPDDTTLKQITSEPVVLDDEQQTEFMLDASRVRAAYLVDVPENTMILDLSEVPVSDIDAERAEAVTRIDWPTPAPLDQGMSR